MVNPIWILLEFGRSIIFTPVVPTFTCDTRQDARVKGGESSTSVFTCWGDVQALKDFSHLFAHLRLETSVL